MQKSIPTTIKLYYLFQACFNLLVWIPIYYEFQKQIGLSDKNIFDIQAIYYIAFLVLEVPTGHIADSIGKKTALNLGAFFLFLANLLPIFFHSFTAFLIHFLVIAAARSLVSGSASAYLFDHLKEEKMQQNYKEIEGKARSLILISRVIVWPIGGLLMAFIPSLPYLLTCLFCFTAFLASFKMPKLQHEMLRTEKKRFHPLKEINAITSILKTSPILFNLMIQGSVIFILQRVAMVQLFQPILKEKNFSLESFGIIMSTITIFESLGSFQAFRLKKLLGDSQAIFILSLIGCLLFTLLAPAKGPLALVLLALFSLSCGLCFPLQKQLLNENISAPQYRATILSVESIIQRLLAAAFTYFIGIKMQLGDLDHLIYYTSIALSIILIANRYISSRIKDTL